MNTDEKLIAIVGATATGKTDLGIYLAKRYKGEIVSADSRQIYKELSIGTAKITKRQQRGVPHHMIDVVNVGKYFSVANYQKMAHEIIQDIIYKGKLPFIVGGTGLYIKSITDNPNYPGVPPDEKLRKKLNRLSAKDLMEMLTKKDKKRAQTIDSKNKVRLIRAIEILESKPSIGKLQKRPIYKTLKLGIAPQDDLRERIEKRFYEQIRKGAIQEVQDLRDNKISWKKIQDIGLQYRYIAKYLQGKISKKQMEEKSIIANYRYAKRQITWFKKDKEIRWVENKTHANHLIALFMKKQ